VLLLSGGVLFMQAGSFLAGDVTAPEQGDLIVVLGGDAGARSMRSVELYLQGYAPRILLSGLEDGEAPVQTYYLNWRAQYLMASGIPRRDILYDARSQNTWEEACDTLALMKRKGWRHVLVVSDPPHMRRLQWVWSRTFKDSGRTFSLCASRPFWWDEKRWWGNELSAKFVIMEYLKIAYYLLKY
jgi:uncharacterized SAM-binding protein YcdF (DUF218 family)